MILTEIISAVLQVIAFTVIPFIFFLFRKDKQTGFFKYIGLYKPTGRSVYLVLIAAVLMLAVGISMAFISEGIRQAMFSPNSVTGKLRLMGFSGTSVVILLITALIKTSLSEEILFRGFIAKQLIRKSGFRSGNIIQSLIFGFVHIALFFAITSAGAFALLFIFVFSIMAGWVIGFIKEKYAGGSIIPGWIAHGLGNTASYFIIAFVL
jgi:membrane protease YdiL (CAAX protease family)